MIDLLQKISDELTIPLEALSSAVNLNHVRCRRIKIPKKGGGHRYALQPAAAIKPVLAWLQIHLISKLQVNTIATAFRPSTSILDNAARHKDSLYSLRVDITGFFPAIKSVDLWNVILREKSKLPTWASESSCFQLLEKVCFDLNQSLPIGFLTSPAIANAVMYEIDNALSTKISDINKFGNATLTRYADDFVFSTEKKGACNVFYKEFSDLLQITGSPKLKVNLEKNRYMSRGGGSTLITGLRINNQANVVVHKKYRNHIRLLMKLYSEERLQSDETQQLVGHLAFIEHVDPALFTKLSFKYYDDIAKLRESKAAKARIS